MHPRWTIKKADEKVVTGLAAGLNISRLTAHILANRGIASKEDGERFLRPRLAHLPDPFLLPDMEKATERILKAVKASERITIFGDYDTDGITGTALLLRFFREAGVEAGYYLPNRLSEGYGISMQSVEEIRRRGSKLIITTDNGTNFRDEIARANSLGMDVVVTDHHEITGDLPPALAIVNPKRLGAASPFSELAGVGVAFYLAAAVRSVFRREGWYEGDAPDLKSFLDLVAVGTIADVAPLTGINRILVKNGIEMLRRSENLGLRALAASSSMDIGAVNAHAVAYRLAPRINAAGRLGDQDMGLKLLLTKDAAEANGLAAELSRMNSERQAIEKRILADAAGRLGEEAAGRMSIVLASEGWHPGVIGIVAARLAEEHCMPCALVSIDGGCGRGSVRSIEGFNIMETLAHCAPVLANFGGHAGAAGFDVAVRNIGELSRLFEEHVSSLLTEEIRTPCIHVEGEMDISEMSGQFLREIEMLEPYGEGNPEPVFATRACVAEGARIVGNNHLKLMLKSGRTYMDAIGFDMGGAAVSQGGSYRFAATPQRNEWNGEVRLQLKLKGVEKAGHVQD